MRNVKICDLEDFENNMMQWYGDDSRLFKCHYFRRIFFELPFIICPLTQ